MTRGALRRPEPLGPGAHVRVVAPSGPVDAARLERGLAALRRLGLEVSVARHVLGLVTCPTWPRRTPPAPPTSTRHGSTATSTRCGPRRAGTGLRGWCP